MIEWPDIVTSDPSYLNRFQGKLGAWLLEVQEKLIRLLVSDKITPQDTVLDVGGGHGQTLTALTGINENVTVRLSEQSGNSLIEGFTCTQDRGDLYPLPYEDGSFTFCTAIRILTHVDNPELLISELCRVSAKFVLIDYPPLCSFNCLYSLIFFIKRAIEKDTRIFTIFTHAQMSQLVQKLGYTVVTRKNQFFWPVVLHRIHKRAWLGRLLETPMRMLGATALFGSPTIVLLEKVKK